MIRILIVDDQKTVRESIKVLLANVSDFTVIGTANDGLSAIAQVAKLNPDVVLMDIEMPKLNGLKATEIISRHNKQIKILILTSHDRDDLIAQALYVGATGYLLKNMSSQQIIRAIRFASEGYTEIRPSIGVKNNSSQVATHSLASTNLLLESKTPTEQGIVRVTANGTAQTTTIETDAANPFSLPLSNLLVLLGLVGLSLFVAAILIANKWQPKISITAPGIIQPLGEWQLVQAAITGKITKIAVRENQQVQAGKAIAKIDDSTWQSRKQQLLGNIQQTKQQLTQLDAQISSIKQQILAEQDLQQYNVAQAEAQLKYQQQLAQNQLLTLEAQVEEAAAAVTLSQQELNRYRQLANKGVISQLQFQAKEAALQTKIAQLKQIKSSSTPNPEQVNILQQQISQARAKGETIIAKLNREQEQLKEQKIKSQVQLNNYQEELNRINTKLDNTLIRTPIAGTIEVLNLRNPGQVVRPGDNIAQIAPVDSPLGIKAVIASDNIAHLETGQTAKIQVSACPVAQYGTLSGKVLTIVPQTKLATNQQYELSIQPQKLSLTRGDGLKPNREAYPQGNRHCSLKSGMTGKIEILVTEESLFDKIIRTIKNSINN